MSVREIADRAGNALDGEFRGTFPSGNGIAGGNFRARLVYNGRTVLAPQALPAGAQLQSTSVEPPAGPLGLAGSSRRGR